MWDKVVEYEGVRGLGLHRLELPKTLDVTTKGNMESPPK